MWSDKYWFYNIQSDIDCSQKLQTNIIVEILSDTGLLNKIGPQSFTNNINYPSISISCVMYVNGGYAHDSSDSTEYCNLIAVTASKNNLPEKFTYQKMLKDIANKLNWILLLEEGEDGEENILL